MPSFHIFCEIFHVENTQIEIKFKELCEVIDKYRFPHITWKTFINRTLWIKNLRSGHLLLCVHISGVVFVFSLSLCLLLGWCICETFHYARQPDKLPQQRWKETTWLFYARVALDVTGECKIYISYNQFYKTYY